MGAFRKRTQSSQNTGQEVQQRRRLQLALAVLVIALFVVVISDVHDLRPPALATPDNATVGQNTPSPIPSSGSPEVQDATTRQEPPRKASRAKRAKGKKPVVNASQSGAGSEVSAGPMIVATDRAVLPPLEVSVVAGNQNRPLAPKSNSVDVDMQSGNVPQSPEPAPPIADNEQRQPGSPPKVTVSRDVAERVEHSVAPSYPLLAKQMKVQGAVVLQALIDKGGHIQRLHVVSGPAILAAAAQEAVKQWRFKPYYQNGQPVETEARVSVNFTISTF